MKRLSLYILTLLSYLSWAQNPQRTFASYELKNNELSIRVNDGLYRIRFYSSEIVQTTFLPNGESYNAYSHAVVMNPSQMETELKDLNNALKFSSGNMEVKIQKQPFQISYFKEGEYLISEKAGYQKDSLEKIQFNLTKDEVLYGGGTRALGMNRRGYRLQLYNRAHYGYETHSELMNFTMPIVLSSKQYLLHFDNAPIGFLDLDSKKDNTLTYETISGRKTYQIIVGDSWGELMKNYTQLTGRQPLLPRWALGNFSSRFGYHTQEEVIETIKTFRQEGMPVDAIILDLYWFGKTIQGTMGNLEFDRDSFPDPKKMIKSLEAENVKTVLITEPFILTTSSRWEEAVKKSVLAKDSLGNPYTYDFYFGHTGLIDIYGERGYQWFKSIYEGLFEMGVAGIWGDLGEPEVHPSGLMHKTGTADELHNVYGHDWARLVKDAYNEYDHKKRPFILMRAGYSGSQRHGMVPWSGDVNRTWGGLQSQPKIVLQMGMQGMAFMHSDLGGFAGANLDDELYVRWLQYGVFQPIYRPHAQEDVPSEPIFRSDKAKRMAKKAIELRYQLLPYNYNLAFENNQKGMPLMRPLFFEEPFNETMFEYSNTYLWGQDFLVSPILHPNVENKEVYFPKGSNWYDFYTGEKIEGGQVKAISVNEETIPTFVRAGAIIPMARPIKSTKEYKGNELIIHYYFDENIEDSEYELYNDDGLTTNAFENGQYELLEFEVGIEGRILEFEMEAETGSNFETSNKSIALVIHNIEKPRKVKMRKKLPVNYDENVKTLTIPFQWDTKTELELKIKL